MITDLKKVSFTEIVEKLTLTTLNQSKDLSTSFVLNVISSDLMSDVLMVGHDIDLLITSLATDQAIRTANIMDMAGIIIVNGKEITENMKELAQEFHINLFSSSYSKYETCCMLYDLQKGRG
jgi:predicted transcriptional regulator